MHSHTGLARLPLAMLRPTRASVAFGRDLLPFLFLTISVAACDPGGISGDVSGEGEDGVTLAPASQVEFQVNDISVVVDSTGQLTNAKWHAPDGGVSLIFQAGLWLASVQDGAPRANLSWVGTYPTANYAATWGGKRSGVFHLEPSDFQQRLQDWPPEFGAPVDAEGNPHLYGDGMTWSALTSRAVPDESVLAQPLVDVVVRQAVYAYDNSDLNDVLFVRYEIENRSTVALNDVYVGFHADTDLAYGEPFSGDECRSSAATNNTAYDKFRALSYTFDFEQAASGGVGSGCPATVTGTTFLESPTGGAPEDVVTSHRIMRKNNYADPDFGETAITSAEHVLNALKGLSGPGEPMVNPVTGEETMYAFTGNPTARTGWLDAVGGIDVRSLLTSGPFTLSPGDPEVLVLAISAQTGETLSNAIKSLKSQVDRLRGAPDLWKFADVNR